MQILSVEVDHITYEATTDVFGGCEFSYVFCLNDGETHTVIAPTLTYALYKYIFSYVVDKPAYREFLSNKYFEVTKPCTNWLHNYIQEIYTEFSELPKIMQIKHNGEVIYGDEPVVTKEESEDTEPTTFDAVNNPAHYASGKYECIEVMEDNFGKEKTKDFCLLNAFKYLFRCNKKHKTPIEDIKKAIWYLNHYLEIEDKRDEKAD